MNCFSCNNPIPTFEDPVIKFSQITQSPYKILGTCNCNFPTSYNKVTIDIKFNQKYRFLYDIQTNFLTLVSNKYPYSFLYSSTIPQSYLSKSLLNNIINALII